jgi:hypothetical protein
MPYDLFVRLARHAPTPGKTSIENFFTKLIGYVLEREEAAREEFLDAILGRSGKGFRVRTQVMTQSANADLSGLYLDLVLFSDEEELFVENKVGDELGERQLGNYLKYASERGNAHVVVASRAHNPIVDKYAGRDPQFIGEMLWWKLADRWRK